MTDLAGRLRHRVQLTSDGHKPYLAAVEDAFGADIDYATLTKIYGIDPQGERRYSPPVCLGCETRIVTGDPDPKAHFDQLHRAPELDRSYHDAPVYPPVEWLQPED